MASIWIATLSVILLVYLLQKLLSPKNKKNLPPGPRSLPILGHFHLLGKNPHQDLHSLARKHGPIMGLRFGSTPTIIVSSPAISELILKTHDLVFASRPGSQANKHVGYGQRNLIFGKYGPYWRDMRKLCTLELLSNLRISQFQAMRRAELGILVSSLKRAANNGETVDLSARISGLSGDMNCLMIFGKKYADSDLDERGFKGVIAETMEIGAKFNLADYFPYIEVLDLQGMNRRMKELSRIFDGFLEKIIDEHVQNKKAGKNDGTEDFVDTMMSIMESGEAGFEFDRRNVKAVLQDLLIAGMDTSSTAVEWALSELFRHPQIMKKLQNELESVVGLDHMVEEQHLHTLEYLDAVIKESLRLHPVAPLLIPHESMEDCVIDGFHIPEKSRILVNTWAIGRDPNVWPDPETFSPERFIGSHIDLRGQDFQLLPFGSGRRGCPGLQLGLTLVKLLVAQLVHCFDWELPNGMLPGDLDMSEHFGLVTSRVEHLMAIPTCRLCNFNN
ncbi:cytochrome p450 cyp736a12 [Phtheirospermum japonicum]|uniref:Cytochrome p450 cyp736a12 n=1 Tax=Phtheirospermum japonicum TaxID=374723 RepID=A0A830C7U0_9LAMI|nr:cytochrome p450 cyp736a12 [Phtheirospermum japonicum]